MILPSDAPKFATLPETLCLNRYIRVTGTEYEGTPEIIVNEPAQIEIVNP